MYRPRNAWGLPKPALSVAEGSLLLLSTHTTLYEPALNAVKGGPRQTLGKLTNPLSL